MGSNKTPAVGANGKLQGIAIHDPRIQSGTLKAVGAAAVDSDYTEQGPRAGIPEPAQRSNLVLKASGGQTARTDYAVQVRAAGHPIPSDGSFIWYSNHDDGPDNDEPYGHDGYQVVTGWNGAIQNKTVVDGYGRPDIIRLRNDYLLATWRANSAAPILFGSYNPQTGKWTVLSRTMGSSVADNVSGTLVGLPSGRVVCFFLDGQSKTQVHAISSDDNGGTWTSYATGCLTAKAKYEVVALVARYSAGVVLLMTEELEGGTYTMEQWVSYDLGATFDRVGADWKASTTPNPEEPSSVSLEALDNGTFLISYADRGSNLSAGTAQYRVGVVDPSTPIYSQGLLHLANHNNTECPNYSDELTAHSWVWRDEDRTCYFLGNFGSGQVSSTQIQRSEDGGHTWKRYEGAAVVHMPGMVCTKFAANSVGGRASLLTFFDGANMGEGEDVDGFADTSRIFLIYLGGHAKQTVASIYNGLERYDPVDMLTWSKEGAGTLKGSNDREGAIYLPVAPPDDTGWVETTTGTGSAAFSSTTGALGITTGTGIYFLKDTAVGFPHIETLAVGVKLTVVSNDGDRTTADVALQLDVSNFVTSGSVAATQLHRVVVYFDTTGFLVKDPLDGSTIVSVDYDMTKPTWLYVTIKTGTGANPDGEVAVFYGRDSEHPLGSGGLGTQRRALTKAVATETLVNNAAAEPSATCVVSWGHMASGDAVSLWEVVGWTVAAGAWQARLADNYVGAWRSLPYSDPQVTQSALNGREWSTVPALLIDQVRMSAGDGPGKLDEQWTIKPRFDFPVENLDVLNNASPRVPWRSAQETAGATLTEQAIVWDMEESSPTQFQKFGNSAILVLLLNCNFKTAYLQRFHSSAWETIATLDASVDLSGLKFTRTGASVIPNFAQSGSAPKWIHRASLVGGTLDLGAGGGLVQYKHIRSNTEGGWVADGTSTVRTRVPRVFYETGELTSSDVASGTCAIWRRNFGALIFQADQKTIDQSIRLLLPAQANADGYFQIGSIVIGEVAAFGHQFDRGLTWTTRPNVLDYSRPDGSRRPHSLGPARRTAEFAWSETAVDETRVQGGLADTYEDLPGTANSPDFVASALASADPLASVTDSVSLMEGIMREVDGSSQPVVFLPRIPVQASHSTILLPFNDDKLFLYGRIDGDHSYSVVQGNEGAGEVQRLNKITINEEV
ncbi:hypothetical protein CMI37_06350 [Candidatus Pacearchaeota archaeon]|nr:hypothetical protein [Candidatus Pacearchaeota archaeon]